jgi:hypothetical protein
VVASLLVSVLLVGIKVTAAKELKQVAERRKELKANLSLLQRRLEDADRDSWIDDVTLDTQEREDRIAELEASAGNVCDPIENGAIEKGLAMFALYNSSSCVAKHLQHSPTVLRSEVKHDEASGLVLGLGEAEYRSTPQQIVSFILNYDSRNILSNWRPETDVRAELVQKVNGHHSVVFIRKRSAGLDRTFLNSLVAKKVAGHVVAYVLVVAPIATHAKITAKDEKGAVRGEVWRTFKCTEVAPSRTKVC